jgi:hypothetical protein
VTTCFGDLVSLKPIQMTPRSKAWFCASWLAGIAGSNPAGGLHVCLVQMCCAGLLSMRRADPSSRGGPTECGCVCVCVSVLLLVIRCNTNPLHLH